MKLLGYAGIAGTVEQSSTTVWSLARLKKEDVHSSPEAVMDFGGIEPHSLEITCWF